MNSTDFSPAPAQILVLPDKENQDYGEVRISGSETDMPTGEVISCGRVPKGYPKLCPGDRIAYNRGIATFVTVTRNGLPLECRIVSMIDFRGKFSKNEEEVSIMQRVLRSPYFIGFAAGSIFGVVFRSQILSVAGAWIRSAWGRTVDRWRK